MTKCPDCEYNKARADMWRRELYKHIGYVLPVPSREWQGLTDEEFMELMQSSDVRANILSRVQDILREKNT